MRTVDVVSSLNFSHNNFSNRLRFVNRVSNAKAKSNKRYMYATLEERSNAKLYDDRSDS